MCWCLYWRQHKRRSENKSFLKHGLILGKNITSRISNGDFSRHKDLQINIQFNLRFFLFVFFFHTMELWNLKSLGTRKLPFLSSKYFISSSHSFCHLTFFSAAQECCQLIAAKYGHDLMQHDPVDIQAYASFSITSFSTCTNDHCSASATVLNWLSDFKPNIFLNFRTQKGWGWRLYQFMEV